MVKMPGPRYALFQVVDGLVAQATVEAVSPTGQQLFPMSGAMAQCGVAQEEADADELLYKRVRTAVTKCKVPRLLVRNPQGESIVLGPDNAAVATTAVPIGVDELFEEFPVKLQ